MSPIVAHTAECMRDFAKVMRDKEVRERKLNPPMNTQFIWAIRQPAEKWDHVEWYLWDAYSMK